MLSNIDHARCIHANAKAVDWLHGGKDKKEKESAKRYRSVTNSSAMQVRQVGLMQTAVFWMSKEQQERNLLKAVFEWLRCGEATTHWIWPNPAASGEIPALMKEMLEFDSEILAMLDNETVLYLSQLRRLVDGRFKHFYPEESES